MIKVDISNVWGQVTLSDLLAMEKEVAAAHTTLADGTGAGNDFLGWQNLPVREATEEITRIQRAAEKIRSDSDVFVVIGIGGSYLGARAAIEFLQSPNYNVKKKNTPDARIPTTILPVIIMAITTAAYISRKNSMFNASPPAMAPAMPGVPTP